MSRLNKEERKSADFLDELEAFMNLVRNEYDLFFLGLIKKPPEDKARELRRKIYDMDQMVIMNSGTSFKRKVLRSRYNTLSLYWQRVVLQIEAGTYSRLRRRLAFREAEALKTEADNRLRKEREEAARQLLEQKAVEQSRPKPPPPSPERVYALRSEGLFDAYRQAREHTGEALSGLSAERLRQTLETHEAAIKQKFGCSEVVFRVMVENGKATIKAVPRR